MSTLSRSILPISKDEFIRMVRKCVPPTGWPRVIGVANSGGPDSTCLLFLIHQYLKDSQTSADEENRQRVVSMTVDHDLQSSSSAMAQHCADVSRSIGVEHITAKIPWSQPPFPSRPSEGEMFESTARLARYHLLLQSMTRAGADVLAFGHHADDQVETSLMRLGRGTTELGAGGMRPCRRWGMGMGRNEESLGWAGYEGMKKWIIRPLLDVNKDRILATCEENNLNYLMDGTNFQPHLTLRNAIRDILAADPNKLQTDSKPPIPPDITEKLSEIDSAISSLQSVSVDLTSGADQLRGAVKLLASRVEDIDHQVDSYLHRCRLPSPPGTLLLASRSLTSVRDKLARSAMILRIMRYVSFHPWGSVRADGNRRQASIEQIIDKVWNPNPLGSNIRMFVAGGGVLWTPVVVRGGQIKTPDRLSSGVGLGETAGWLASRQPPLSRQKMEERGIANPLRLDLTALLSKKIAGWKNGTEAVTFEILYDCRFIIRFDLAKVPHDILTAVNASRQDDSIAILPNTRWYWPQVVHKTNDEINVLHSKISESQSSLQLLGGQKIEGDHTVYWRRRDDEVSSTWITIEWIRPLGAL